MNNDEVTVYELVSKIQFEIQEDLTDFILKTISPYCEQIAGTISKDELKKRLDLGAGYAAGLNAACQWIVDHKYPGTVEEWKKYFMEKSNGN